MKLTKSAKLAVALLIGCIGFATQADTASAATPFVARSFATVGCTQSNMINTTVHVSHNESSRYIYARAWYYKWNGQDWQYTGTAKDNAGWISGSGALNVSAPVTAQATANGPAYFLVVTQAWVWNGSAYAAIGSPKQPDAYTNRYSTGSYCTITR